MAGLSSTGLVIKDLAEIVTDLETSEHADIDASLDVSDETFVGQINSIFADHLDQAWQAINEVYAAAYRASATGVQLDAIGQLTGTVRLPAVASTTQVVAIGTNGTALPSGRIASVSGAPSSRFTTASPYTIATVSAWGATTAYAVGALVTNDTGKLYYCKTAGTSAGSGGPTGTGAAITDGTCVWVYVATAPAAVTIDIAAESTGATTASAGTLTVIETPVSGWTSVTNPLDATIGRNVETDEAYRQRQESELRVTGAGAVDAIAADVANVSGVTACTVFENVTDTTDVNSVPPHAFETLVLGGVDQDVANRIWASKPAGIATYGSTSVSVTDSQGTSHTVNFSRPTLVPFYLVIDVKTDSTFPSDGAAQIKNALVAFWASKNMGDDVIRSQLFSPIDAITGTYDVTNIKLGTAPAPSGTSNITITSRQLATLTAGNITVNVT